MPSWLVEFSIYLPQGLLLYLLVLLIAFFESIPLAGLIMPGSTLAVLFGFLAYHDTGSFAAIAVSAAIGAFLGDSFSFWLGRKFGVGLLKTRRLRRQRKLTRLASLLFVHHGGKSLFFARFLGPIRGTTPFIAGLFRMSGRSFLIYTLISAALWGICYPGVGYVGGKSWHHAEQLSVQLGLIVTALVLMTAAHYLTKMLFKNLARDGRSKKDTENSD